MAELLKPVKPTVKKPVKKETKKVVEKPETPYGDLKEIEQEKIPQTGNFYLKFMHMGKGKPVVKIFKNKEEAYAYGKTKQPWMESGVLKYPELIVEPGIFEVVE